MTWMPKENQNSSHDSCHLNIDGGTILFRSVCFDYFEQDMGGNEMFHLEQC